MTITEGTTSGSTAAEVAQDAFPGWPLIEIYGVGPDGTCQCPKGANCPPRTAGKHPRARKVDDVLLNWADPANLTDPSTWRKRANVGVLTGAPAGFWVLDIDQAGMGPMQALIREHGLLPTTRVHQTGGGTYHYFFAMPDFEVTNRRGTLPAGIDVRGTGGQVVLPPSRSRKGEYTVVRDSEIVPAPQWLLDMVRAEVVEEEDEPVTDSAPVVPAQEVVTPEREQYLADYESMVIRKEIERLASMSKAKTDDLSTYRGLPWDITTYETACTLMQLARSDWTSLTLDEAADIVREHAPRDAGFDEARISEKILSARRSTRGKDRAKPTKPAQSNTAWFDDMDSDGSPAADQRVERPTLHSMTDVGNARRLADRRGDFLRWTADAGQWMAYDGRRWDRLGADTIARRLAIETMEETLEAESPFWSDVPDEYFANGQPKPTPRERFAGWCHTSLMESRLKAMVNVAQSEPRLTSSMGAFVGVPHLLNTGNCIVDLRDGSTMPHDPALLLADIAGADYDPDAKAPMFEAFLERVQPDPAMRDYIQTVAGYSATGETTEQAFFLHFGSGANGKSVFLEIIRRILGTMGQKVARDTLYSKGGQTGGVPSDIAAMVGARLLTASETAAGRKLDDERIKELVGGEAQRARHLYGTFFDFQPTGKIHLGTNHLPPMESGGHGMARRLRVVPWDVRIPEAEQKKGLEELIVANEAAGVLAWLVRGAQRWYAEGLVTPQRVTDRTAVHIDDADPVWPFIRERLITEDPEVSTDFKSIVGAYVGWCDMHNVRPMSGPALSAALSERLGEDIRFKHPRTRASMFRVRVNLQAVPAVTDGATGTWLDEVGS